MSKVVRSSKFRHVFAEAPKKEKVWTDIKPSNSAWDANWVYANPTYWAVCWHSGGAGTFGIGKLNEPAFKWSPQTNFLFSGHKALILDLDFNPFNDDLIASSSEDGLVKIWSLSSMDGAKEHVTDSVQTLKGHKRKVGAIQHHPLADNVLGSTSLDFAVKIWDIEKGTELIQLDGHADIIQSFSWSLDGASCCTSSKDKKLRTFDVRGKTESGSVDGAHMGTKGFRSLYLGGTDFIFTCGFSKTQEREYAFWDNRKLGEPLKREKIDTASGLLMPFWDEDTKILFLAGKGDGNIRYYEVVPEDNKVCYYLSEYKSNTPTKGLAMIPKRGVNVSECEIMRGLKLTTNTLEPLSFQVPRRSEVFQEDLYPDCFDGNAVMTAEQWMGGASGTRTRANMENGFVAKEKKEFKPTVIEEKKLTPAEMEKQIDELTKRVAFLEAEIVKKDAQIKSLQS